MTASEAASGAAAQGDSPRPLASTPPRTSCCSPSAALAPSPETAVKRLIATIDSMQQQQAHAEARRLGAEQTASAAAAEAHSLQVLLHAELRQLEEMDDRQQAAHAALDAGLLQQAQRSEQLRQVQARVAALRAESAASNGNGSPEEEHEHERQLQQKHALAAELQHRLRLAGVEESTIAQLCSDAAAHSAVAGGQAAAAQQQQQQPDGGVAGLRKAPWLGGGGLLSSFRRRTTAT
ncbi:expressed protein [Chlorella variabilis]|uniref:Expressed protein n=1 Tax=Chlorella variabilis TaxID=554065 RepID=E1ZKV3_CHLVA|nr:expressed protein [Chlorella variabilis]EFN53554.1 expressed protein [Chlorella variabilis]|eukprot:XP_005845656.1 expressed protein [Chlorella variabilis]